MFEYIDEPYFLLTIRHTIIIVLVFIIIAMYSISKHDMTI